MAEESNPPQGNGQHSSKHEFAQLAEAFESLRALDATAQQQRLATLRANDPSLASALRSLLAEHCDDPDALASPDRAFAPTVVGDALREACADPDHPTTLGPYRIVRALGHGGMGSVYLAEHEGSDLDRQVAVKVLRTARHNPELLQRFRTERRILGALQHPNIATLYESGSTDDGQPFVAMEYVDGPDLVSFCDARSLPIEHRLDLFVKVCRAVAHAHRALVVHRDLKPSNVLVTTSGEPKLLDFGIAKLLHDGGTDNAHSNRDPQTRTGDAMLTPEYCSPEQVRGESITTSTDVYALGALLFELLTGERAQPRAGQSMQDMLAVVCERTPPTASAAVRRGPEQVAGRPESRTRWSRRLDGDLDTIIRAAMQKEPARRYASAAALAEDLQRHLRGMPVTARPDTLGYRTAKFVRRNRLPVVAGILLLATLLTFAIVTAHDNRTIQLQLDTIRAQNETIRDERDTARNESAVADQVVEFLASLYDMAAPDPDRAETLRARELLDRGARRIARELADLPAQRAPLQLAMGRAYIALGIYEQAEPLLVAAEATYAQLAKDSADHREAQFQLGGLRLHQSNLAEGERLLRQSWQPATGSRTLHPAAAAARRGALASWLRTAGRFDEALKLVQQARQVAGEHLGTVARAGTSLDLIEATILGERGQLEAARDLALAAIAKAELRDGKDYGHHANLYRQLGQIHQSLGELDQAHAAMQRALDIDRKLSGDDHPDVDASLFAVAMVEIDRGEWQQAAESLREVLARDERRFGKQHANPALSKSQLATVLGNLGQSTEADQLFAEALAAQKATLPDEHPEIATTIANMGSHFNRTGRYDEAARCFEEALARRLAIYRDEHPSVLTTRQQLAVLELARGNAKVAEQQFRTLLNLRSKVRGEHSETAGSLLSLATCIARQGRPAEAIPLFVESTQMFRKTLPPGHETTARPLLGEALARLRMNEPAKALPLLREAESLRIEALGETHFRTLYTQFWLCRCLMQDGQNAAARDLAKVTLAKLQKHMPADRLTTEVEKLLARLPE